MSILVEKSLQTKFFVISEKLFLTIWFILPEKSKKIILSQNSREFTRNEMVMQTKQPLQTKENYIGYTNSPLTKLTLCLSGVCTFE